MLIGVVVGDLYISLPDTLPLGEKHSGTKLAGSAALQPFIE